jgi:hypothetical protein
VILLHLKARAASWERNVARSPLHSSGPNDSVLWRGQTRRILSRGRTPPMILGYPSKPARSLSDLQRTIQASRRYSISPSSSSRRDGWTTRRWHDCSQRPQIRQTAESDSQHLNQSATSLGRCSRDAAPGVSVNGGHGVTYAPRPLDQIQKGLSLFSTPRDLFARCPGVSDLSGGRTRDRLDLEHAEWLRLSP